MSISARRKLIEIELTKIRGLAEQVNDDYLVYFIDMAISEVEARINYRNDNKEEIHQAGRNIRSQKESLAALTSGRDVALITL